MSEIGITDLCLSCADRAVPLRPFRRRRLGLALGRLALGLTDFGLPPLRSICSIGALVAFLTAPRAWRGVASASTPRLRNSLANVSRQFCRSVRFGASLSPSGPTALMLTRPSASNESI
jgi:hypothetical protein